MDKHYLSMFYGVDEALPDEEFARQIGEINDLAREAAERMQSMSHLQIIQEPESVTVTGGEWIGPMGQEK